MKLKDLLKESKYLKREFGEKLPTLDSVMKQHQESKEPLVETHKQKVKTRFGILEIEHQETPTAPGFPPLYIVDVFLNKQPLADINIEGDPRDNPYTAKVKVMSGKKKIKMRH